MFEDRAGDRVAGHGRSERGRSALQLGGGFARRLGLRKAARVVFGLLALGQVAGDLAEADQLAASLRSAVITTFAQNRVPSLRRRQPSSAYRPSAAAIPSSSCGLAAAASSCG